PFIQVSDLPVARFNGLAHAQNLCLDLVFCQIWVNDESQFVMANHANGILWVCASPLFRNEKDMLGQECGSPKTARCRLLALRTRQEFCGMLNVVYHSHTGSGNWQKSLGYSLMPPATAMTTAGAATTTRAVLEAIAVAKLTVAAAPGSKDGKQLAHMAAVTRLAHHIPLAHLRIRR